MKKLLWFISGVITGMIALTLYEIFGKPTLPTPDRGEWEAEYPEEFFDESLPIINKLKGVEPTIYLTDSIIADHTYNRGVADTPPRPKVIWKDDVSGLSVELLPEEPLADTQPVQVDSFEQLIRHDPETWQVKKWGEERE